jgi:hypothetical protein
VSLAGSLAASLAASLLATLSRPAWWAMALAAFLARGGILVVLLPIVTLPTVAGLANACPALVGFVFGGPSARSSSPSRHWPSRCSCGSSPAACSAAASTRARPGRRSGRELEAGVAPRSGGPGRPRGPRHRPPADDCRGRLGAVRLVEASYTSSPGRPVDPGRRQDRPPDPGVALLAATWLVGEALGGLAVRHLAWGASVPSAIGRAIRSLVRPSASRRSS